METFWIFKKSVETCIETIYEVRIYWGGGLSH